MIFFTPCSFHSEIPASFCTLAMPAIFYFKFASWPRCMGHSAKSLLKLVSFLTESQFSCSFLRLWRSLFRSLFRCFLLCTKCVSHCFFICIYFFLNVIKKLVRFEIWIIYVHHNTKHGLKGAKDVYIA